MKCAFTGKEEYDFKGIHLLKNDGTVEYYSSGKAFKNARKLKRDKRKLKWTEAYRIARKKVIEGEAKIRKAENSSK